MLLLNALRTRVANNRGLRIGQPRRLRADVMAKPGRVRVDDGEATKGSHPPRHKEQRFPSIAELVALEPRQFQRDLSQVRAGYTSVLCACSTRSLTAPPPSSGFTRRRES